MIKRFLEWYRYGWGDERKERKRLLVELTETCKFDPFTRTWVNKYGERLAVEFLSTGYLGVVRVFLRNSE